MTRNSEGPKGPPRFYCHIPLLDVYSYNILCQIYIVRKAPYPQELPFKPLRNGNLASSMQIKHCKVNSGSGPEIGCFRWLACHLGHIVSHQLAIGLHTFPLSLLARHLLRPRSPLPLVADTNPFARRFPAPRRQAAHPMETVCRETKAVSRHTVSVASPIACPFQDVKIAAHPLSLPFSHPQDAVRCRPEHRAHRWRILIIVRHHVSVSFVLVCPASASFHLDN